MTFLELPMRFGSDASRSAHHTEDSYRASDSALSRQAISNAENASMREAVNRALQARAQSGKAGIAAAIVLDGQVVGQGENEVRLQSDPTKHAEMVALTEAAKSMGTT
ncbi:deaminase, partial [Devosia sp. Leaf420]|uniref:deaminase n=1 Tax=Devosia sp. Leaf420 TaxID=1736374 RepID=UPI001FCD56DD